MKPNVEQVIEAAIKLPVKEAVTHAVNKLLGESEIKAGQTVAVIDQDAQAGGYVGKGRVKSLGNNPDGGFAEVEWENGTVTNCQTSLLIPV